VHEVRLAEAKNATQACVDEAGDVPSNNWQTIQAEHLHLMQLRRWSAVEELYGTRYQSGSFSLFNVGSGFHCLRSFFLFSSSFQLRLECTSG